MRNISHLYVAGSFPTFERDPEISKMENRVFAQMSNITNEIAQKYGHENVQNETVRFVSVEDAIKELAEMKKNKLL